MAGRLFASCERTFNPFPVFCNLSPGEKYVYACIRYIKKIEIPRGRLEDIAVSSPLNLAVSAARGWNGENVRTLCEFFTTRKGDRAATHAVYCSLTNSSMPEVGELFNASLRTLKCFFLFIKFLETLGALSRKCELALAESAVAEERELIPIVRRACECILLRKLYDKQKFPIQTVPLNFPPISFTTFAFA